MIISTTLALLALLSPGQPASPSLDWAKVGKNKKESISGLARWSDADGKTRFVMVLDNKKADEVKICWLVKSDGDWNMKEIKISDPEKLATDANSQIQIKDLEGVCRIPGKEDEVLAIGDKGDAQGWLYRFKLDGDKAVVKDAFQVPEVLPDSDYEGIDLFELDGHIVAAWGDRGNPSRSGTLTVANLDFAKRPNSPFGPTSKITVKTPWPTLTEARSVADVRISGAGDIYVSSVCDPGDSGPFDSAVYIVGRVVVSNSRPTAELYPSFTAVCVAPGHKIEALDFDTNGRELVFGTDDENYGGWIAWYQK